jgi:hypothetical protein
VPQNLTGGEQITWAERDAETIKQILFIGFIALDIFSVKIAILLPFSFQKRN